ncbi:Skp1 family, dimerization domain-containing protein [Biscogniauxia sp. FL1348]|nr:Skp1 family, dimerization domain-containing protein [Biscogniauxia sp. FL1348]
MSSTPPSPSPSTPPILLLSSDNVPFHLTPAAASHSLLLLALLPPTASPSSTITITITIPLPTIPSSVLEPIRALIARSHAQGGVRAVHALVQGAAYLGVTGGGLLAAGCEAVARGIQGCGTVEMRERLGIEEGGGFGPGEEERAREWMVGGGEEEEEDMGEDMGEGGGMGGMFRRG